MTNFQGGLQAIFEGVSFGKFSRGFFGKIRADRNTRSMSLIAPFFLDRDLEVTSKLQKSRPAIAGRSMSLIAPFFFCPFGL